MGNVGILHLPFHHVGTLDGVRFQEDEYHCSFPPCDSSYHQRYISGGVPEICSGMPEICRYWCVDLRAQYTIQFLLVIHVLNDLLASTTGAYPTHTVRTDCVPLAQAVH